LRPRFGLRKNGLLGVVQGKPGGNECDSGGNEGKGTDEAEDVKGKLISAPAVTGRICCVIKENGRG
jgi:hypothetical protein